MGDARGSVAADRAAIADRYRQLLRNHANPLLSDGSVAPQLMSQLNSVLDAVYQVLDLEPDDESNSDADPVTLSAQIGEARAVAGIPPSQSLQAASLIFEAALPTLSSVLRRAGRPAPETTASLTLNRVIMDRMSVAAEFYIGFLLTKMHDSNRDERRRISRELHDVVAPPIALVLQNLQLHDAHIETNPRQAEEKLAAARRAVSEAISSVRALAAETRESLSRNGLEYAIDRVLARRPAQIEAHFEVHGNLGLLPPAYREELFLIVREAIRNALTHAQPNTLAVTLQVADLVAEARIEDDGQGFNRSEPETLARGLGLTSMDERAKLLGGMVVIESESGHGTTVTVKVPLPTQSGRPQVTARTMA